MALFDSIKAKGEYLVENASPLQCAEITLRKIRKEIAEIMQEDKFIEDNQEVLEELQKIMKVQQMVIDHLAVPDRIVGEYYGGAR
jgi:hypothetical protein